MTVQILKPLKSLSFNGSTNSVDLGDPVSLRLLGDKTLLAWVKTADSDSGFRVVLIRNNTWIMYFTGGELRTYDWIGAGAIGSGVSVDDNAWHRLGVAISADVTNGSRFYIDGLPVGSAFTYLTQSASSVNASINGSLVALIGASMLVYSRRLSDAEIAADFAGTAVSRTGLEGEWLFTEGTGNTLADSSGNGNDGTLTPGYLSGGPTWSNDAPPPSPWIAPFTGNVKVEVYGCGDKGTTGGVGNGGDAGGGGGYGRTAAFPVVMGTGYTYFVAGGGSQLSTTWDSGGGSLPNSTGASGVNPGTGAGATDSRMGGQGGAGGTGLEGGGGGGVAGPGNAGGDGGGGGVGTGGGGGSGFGPSPNTGQGGAGGQSTTPASDGLTFGGGGGGDGSGNGGFGLGADAGIPLTYTLPTPNPTSLDVATGPPAGGTPVTITSLTTSFSIGCTVEFGDVTATVLSIPDANTILVTTGAHAAGLVNVVVTNTDSVAGTLVGEFTYADSVGTAVGNSVAVGRAASKGTAAGNSVMIGRPPVGFKPWLASSFGSDRIGIGIGI